MEFDRQCSTERRHDPLTVMDSVSRIVSVRSGGKGGLPASRRKPLTLLNGTALQSHVMGGLLLSCTVQWALPPHPQYFQ